MKKLFIDTNIVISGTFFEGNESNLLALREIELYTCDLVIEETKEVVKRKFKKLGSETEYIALIELENALRDINVLPLVRYKHKITFAKEIISKEKDAQILAAVLVLQPDYFVSGDKDFFSDKVKSLIRVYRTTEVLKELK